MRYILSSSLVAVVALSLTARLSAQANLGAGTLPDPASKGLPVGAPVSAATQWASVKDLGKPVSVVLPAVPDAAAVAQAKQQAITTAIANADQLKSFYTKNPTDANAPEAKCLEAQVLLQASALGDTSQDQRRTQLVADVRKDPAIPIPERAGVAATADHLDVAKRADLTLPQKVSAYEQVVRKLVGEFPTMPDGYESLVHVARDSTDAQAKIIAQDVLAMSAASAGVKAEAQTVLNRVALVGKSLPVIADPILGKDNAVDHAKGHPVIVYTWATFSPGSIAMVKDLATKAPPGAVLIGVCLDFKDLTPAKNRATSEKLPGEQVYDWMGWRGELATGLVLTSPGQAYLTDASGTIRNVSVQRDSASAFASLAH